MDNQFVRNEAPDKNDIYQYYLYSSSYTAVANFSGVFGDVVQISGYNLSGVGLTGSGILIAPGLVLTANHVFDGTLAQQIGLVDSSFKVITGSTAEFSLGSTTIYRQLRNGLNDFITNDLAIIQLANPYTEGPSIGLATISSLNGSINKKQNTNLTTAQSAGFPGQLYASSSAAHDGTDELPVAVTERVMNSPLDLKFDKHAFLRWAEAQEGRFEFSEGRVVMQAGGTRGHARLIARLLTVLGRQLDAAVWSVTASDLAVEIGEDIRYPDIIVEPSSADAHALFTSTPVLVGEVLSPSSLALDLNTKAAEYMSLPSLQAYLVASQSEPRMWLWQRAAEGGPQAAFPKRPEDVFGADAVLNIRALAMEAPLAEIYAGLAP